MDIYQTILDNSSSTQAANATTTQNAIEKDWVFHRGRDSVSASPDRSFPPQQLPSLERTSSNSPPSRSPPPPPHSPPRRSRSPSIDTPRLSNHFRSSRSSSRSQSSESSSSGREQKIRESKSARTGPYSSRGRGGRGGRGGGGRGRARWGAPGGPPQAAPPLHEQPAGDDSNEAIQNQEPRLQPVSMFEGDYGPVDPAADSWCFMRDCENMADTKDDPDPKRQQLRTFAEEYGKMDTFRLTVLCHKYYNEKIRHLLNGKDWTLRSIRSWLENQASDEGINRFAQRVLHQQLILMADTELVTMVNGQRMYNGQAANQLQACLRSLKTFTSGGAGAPHPGQR